MDRRMIHLCYLMLFVSRCLAAPVSENFAVQAGSPVSVQRGLTATLPCWLVPSQSAEDMEVRWYRDGHFDTPAMLYKSRKLDHGSQDPSYAGRVLFGSRGLTSDGLKTGDVSLNLADVAVEDAGNYTCFVSSDKVFDSSSVSLHVTVTGRPPLMSTVWEDGDMVNVSCESEGWYPRPELRWTGRTTDLPADSLVYSNDPAGLFSVHSWLRAAGSSEVSCSVGLSSKEAKVARLRLGSPQEESGSSSAGWVAFGILLVALAIAAVAAVLYFKNRAQSKPGGDQTDGLKITNSSEENKPLLPKEMVPPTALSVATKCHVNVELEKTENPYIKIAGSKIIRDAGVREFPDGDAVTCLTAARGTPRFSSGRHYWEVSMSKDNAGVKKSWWIGVTNNTQVLQNLSFSPNTSNGFWFLSSSPNRGETVQCNTEPEVSFHVQSRPKTVGVYLDYDQGELSFYNVEDKSLIGSVATKFTGEVFPLFNPGKGDPAPMEILQKAEQDQANDNRNSSVQ
ncbi:butyrophilin subfamily 1 member A1-like [Kryptolebias marmoratus]|uniref:butyrophilin subfamily 1 member A1-like n=1 Tax=Kryptolebias marmoratus TaxID=37003 RepID=UPI0007F8EC26|nr:butyrophilin subfamily 1 member A1-like [Kryptolebias marmoratus]